MDNLTNTIAQQLQTLKDNNVRIYNAGYSKGKSEGGSEETESPFKYLTSLSQGFRGVIFPEGYELILNLPFVTQYSYAFYEASGVEKITFSGNENNSPLTFNRAFSNLKDVIEINFEQFNANIAEGNNMFQDVKNLVSIKGKLNFSNCTALTTPFINCTVLQDVELEENCLSMGVSFINSQELSATSMLSIFKGLANVADTVQELTLPARGKLNSAAQAVVDANTSLADDGTIKIIVNGQEKTGWKLVQSGY
jgi:hypothetical protein